MDTGTWFLRINIEESMLSMKYAQMASEHGGDSANVNMLVRLAYDQEFFHKAKKESGRMVTLIKDYNEVRTWLMDRGLLE
jgi:hypothetical protein